MGKLAAQPLSDVGFDPTDADQGLQVGECLRFQWRLARDRC